MGNKNGRWSSMAVAGDSKAAAALLVALPNRGLPMPAVVGVPASDERAADAGVEGSERILARLGIKCATCSGKRRGAGMKVVSSVANGS